MKHKLNAQEKAHQKIRLNKILGFNNDKTITSLKIDAYKKLNPIRDRVENVVLNNLKLSKNQNLTSLYVRIAEKAFCTVSQAKRELHRIADLIAGNKRKSTLHKKQIHKSSFVSTDEFDSAGKRKAHNTLLRLMKDKSSPKEAPILTLANKFQIEKKIIKEKCFSKLTFVSVEDNPHTYIEQTEILSKNNKLKLRTTQCIGDITFLIGGYSKNQFGHIFADFCGQFMGDLKWCSSYILESDLVQVGGIIWFTFDRRSTDGTKNLEIVIPQLVKEWGEGRYKIEEVQTYIGHLTDEEKGNTGSNMITLFVRRIK